MLILLISRLYEINKVVLLVRASYFSQSPTDKMHSVVAAAKALHEQLSQLEDRGIDGGKTLIPRVLCLFTNYSNFFLSL